MRYSISNPEISIWMTAITRSRRSALVLYSGSSILYVVDCCGRESNDRTRSERTHVKARVGLREDRVGELDRLYREWLDVPILWLLEI